jgi:C-terminus of AA_permease/Amino acid permease
VWHGHCLSVFFNTIQQKHNSQTLFVVVVLSLKNTEIGLMGQPRIFYSMSKDGLLFPIYARVNPHTGVPTTGTIITGVLTAMVACLVDLECLANAISLGTLQVFTFVNAGVILLRVQDEDSRPPATSPSSSSSSSSSTLRQPVHVTSYGDGNNSERDCLVVVQEPENADHNDEPIHPTRPVTDPGAAAAVTRSLGLIDETSTQISLRWTSGWSFLQQRQRRQSSSSLGIIRDKPIWLMLLFTTSAILASATIANISSSDDVSDHDAWFFRDFGIGLFCILIMLACTVALWSLPHKSPPPSDTFACPMVPAVPLLGIVCNSYMMGSMSRNTWCIIATWLVLGLLFYFCYGIHHSELRHVDDIIHHHRQHEDDDENKDKNSTTNNKPDDKDNHDFVEWSEESSSTKTRLLPGGNPKENYRGVDTTTTGL